ncbi:tectonic-2 [Thalassophryne amazonica]|uniref:tectonic-2 n=1 Tax=Thalassophryne amazonica TaxID=390379 RepID=UPI001470F9F7|nr:tectonic-2 [Thalassophryne amazonica]
MADVVYGCFSSPKSHLLLFILFFFSWYNTKSAIVFHPSYLTVSGPTATTLLLGNTSDISLYLRTVFPSNTTGYIDPPACVAELTKWILSREQVGKNAVRVQVQLNRSLHLCADNETDCCPKPLCVLETLQLSACSGDTPQASLLIQVRVYALLFPEDAGLSNITVIPNQVYQPLGSCPCDLTLRVCDIRCCCDKDCSPGDLKLFDSHCLLGPFGGQVSPTPNYQCSAVSSEHFSDWIPFLCVTSPPENNPYLGLFYQGDKITPKPGPSFKSPALSAPLTVSFYTQGSPILTLSDQHFTIPQKALGQCVNNAPVAFLKNFKVRCLNLLHSCPTEAPLQTSATDLRIQVKDGQGGVITVEVRDHVAVDLSPFISSLGAPMSSDVRQMCENVTLALDYKFYWKGNRITDITVTRAVGTVILEGSGALTSTYSAVFLNGEFMGEPNSGNPWYQEGMPVVAGIVDTLDNNTGGIQRSTINLWKPVGDGLCSSAEKKPVLFGENSTTGCLLPVSSQNLSQCDLLRETVTSFQSALITSTYVAKSGNPGALTAADWVNISYVTLNSSSAMEDRAGTCYGIPSHQHIHVWTLITGVIDGLPQKEITSVQVSYSLSIWGLECGGGEVSSYVDPMETQLFPVTTSVTFTNIPIKTGAPKTRFQINYTEYDCNRNDVCWPELGFPITRYYTGEPYSQSLAKGLILVFFFLIASVLGTPWRQIRQVWNSTSL